MSFKSFDRCLGLVLCGGGVGLCWSCGVGEKEMDIPIIFLLVDSSACRRALLHRDAARSGSNGESLSESGATLSGGVRTEGEESSSEAHGGRP